MDDYNDHVDHLHDANVVHGDWLSDHMKNEINTKLDHEDIEHLKRIRAKLDDHDDPTKNIF